MAMKNKQMTMDELSEALRRQEETELEERHIAGYRHLPPKPSEFDIPESEHAWGDAAWSEG